jgi:toxin ParE1/3/4
VRRVRFVAAARREFLYEVAYYRDVQPELAVRFTAAVEEATARAADFPLTGSPASKSTRRVFVRDFPFAVVYRPEPEGIVVFALAHHSRMPGYWQSRVQEP